MEEVSGTRSAQHFSSIRTQTVNHDCHSVSQLEDLMHTDEYESDLWFTGQLFIPDWRPPKTIEDPQISR